MSDTRQPEVSVFLFHISWRDQICIISVFTLIGTICPRICSKSQPKIAKTSLRLTCVAQKRRCLNSLLILCCDAVLLKSSCVGVASPYIKDLFWSGGWKKPWKLLLLQGKNTSKFLSFMYHYSTYHLLAACRLKLKRIDGVVARLNTTHWSMEITTRTGWDGHIFNLEYLLRYSRSILKLSEEKDSSK